MVDCRCSLLRIFKTVQLKAAYCINENEDKDSYWKSVFSRPCFKVHIVITGERAELVHVCTSKSHVRPCLLKDIFAFTHYSFPS